MLIQHGANLNVLLLNTHPDNLLARESLGPLAHETKPIEILRAIFLPSYGASLDALFAENRPSAFRKWLRRKPTTIDFTKEDELL